MISAGTGGEEAVPCARRRSHNAHQPRDAHALRALRGPSGTQAKAPARVQFTMYLRVLACSGTVRLVVAILDRKSEVRHSSSEARCTMPLSFFLAGEADSDSDVSSSASNDSARESVHGANRDNGDRLRRRLQTPNARVSRLLTAQKKKLQREMGPDDTSEVSLRAQEQLQQSFFTSKFYNMRSALLTKAPAAQIGDAQLESTR